MITVKGYMTPSQNKMMNTTVQRCAGQHQVDQVMMDVMILLPSQFHYSFPPLLYLSMDTFLFILFLSHYSYMLTHVQHDYSYACSCAYSCAALLTDVLTHAQFCLLICLFIYAYSAYSYTVVVQYIRTRWTPLFGS